jgi:3'-phosphoadenosine 5'-phosphosulfate sulfotransferase (PAPS reductase)/FAD synthetase
MKHIIWWSAGAASTVAAMLHLRTHPDTAVIYCDTRSEHPDNDRFRTDVEQWLGITITVEASTEYTDTWDVWERTGWIVGDRGARCTVELKKRIRQRLADPDDTQVFGYHVGEADRIERFRQVNPDVNLIVPLIDAGLTKADCLGVLVQAGIELPAMYKLGYRNANCIGCPHGGMGYWNMIRRDFPEVFDRMAKLERKVDNACCRPGGVPVFLDELDPTRGDIHTDPDTECSLMCAAVMVDAPTKRADRAEVAA